MASLSSAPLSLRFAKSSVRGLAPRESKIRSASFGRLRIELERERSARRGFRVSASAEVLEGRRKEEEEVVVEERPLKVGIVCGGPSAERGISLNSARSVLDHIQVSSLGLRIICFF